MQLLFSKYHGAGNDFVIIDNRAESFPKSTNLIKHLCDRHFGIGADGLMLLEKATNADFYMRYFNSDGNESTMCGNGGRCITLFAKNIGVIQSSARFMGIDGEHAANFESPNMVNLKMQDVSGVVTGSNFYFLNTGSPHYVCFVDDVQKVDVMAQGRAIRNSYNLDNGGTNVNFIDFTNDFINIRTFERGVEAETLACGTGTVASTIAYYLHTKNIKSEYTIHTQGGELFVKFKQLNDSKFEDIWLKGPANHVFDGQIAV
ncbi:MAG: diaminopimelate epimerase [Bacteroidales bacterium]|nr:MAG: diaminopimelate epimerase [Bacteroidales bacterium]